LGRVSGLRSQEFELRSTLKKAPEGEKAGGAQSGRQLNREALARDLGTGRPRSQVQELTTRTVIFFAAVLADSVDLKCVPRGEVVVLTADCLLELADFLRKELDRAAAIGANHVVMAAAVVLVLVARDAVVESNFAGQAALRKQLQGTVDGGVADASVFFLHQAMEFVSG
jgi:hypothetical protein